MATLKRTDSKPPKERPRRTCVICTEPEDEEGFIVLIKPCRNCHSDYCNECLLDMFLAATTNSSRMPPKCCSLIQIHTIIGRLDAEEAEEYRASFEEWITPVKTYCPSPTCSAFIPEKMLPSMDEKRAPPSLQSVLTEILTKLATSSQARFFRGEMDITVLPGFTAVVENHIDLSIMQDKIDRYGHVNGLTADMALLVSNARKYNGAGHPVTLAAKELMEMYAQELSNNLNRSIADANAPTPQPLFPCPNCHVAICSSCKQIEHKGSPCDVSSADHETAMLATFGYKRCPRCKAGVKKMYGCSHMQCVCGAHWCYYCQRAINECDGTCAEGALDDDEDEAEFDSDEDSMDGELTDEMIAQHRGLPPPVVLNAANPSPTTQRADVNTAPLASQRPDNHAAPPASLQDDYGIVNLDAGGGRRWAEADYDFGDEPEEEGFAQLWSCNHAFKLYEAPPNDGYNRGDLHLMECNRCFGRVRALEPQTSRPKGRKRSRGKEQNSSIDEAVNPGVGMECRRCGLLVCVECRKKYKEPEGAL